jgi:hypothetical protein
MLVRDMTIAIAQLWNICGTTSLCHVLWKVVATYFDNLETAVLRLLQWMSSPKKL